MEHFSPLLSGNGLQFMAEILFLLMPGEINIIEKRLDIKPGATHNNGNVACGADLFNGLFGHLLKPHHMELFRRIKHIDKMVGDALHVLWPDLGGANVHLPVYLHGIRGNDLPAHCTGKHKGQFRFSCRGGAGKDDQWFLCTHNLYNPFEFLFQFPFGHGDDGWPAVGTVIGIL